jgi:hypothetical protein
MRARALAILAGPTARRRIEERGFQLDDVRVMPAASGGPKWLAIAGLDRALAETLFATRTRAPLDLVGSSIGSWRIAAFTQADAHAALARGHAAYIHDQVYTPRPDATEVSAVLGRILDTLLGETGASDLATHPWARAHVITSRGRGLTATRRRAAVALGLGVAAASNVLSRRAIAAHFARVVFSPHAAPPWDVTRDVLHTHHRSLTAANARAVLLASGSIPLVMDGVTIPDEPARVYWDGGITDYHVALPWSPTDGIVLYPHFYRHVVPGWFDKSLAWRRAPAHQLDNVVLLAPSAEFVASLPGGRIPERKDFYHFTPAERIRRWTAVADASARLGDEFRELLATGRWAEVIQPL